MPYHWATGAVERRGKKEDGQGTSRYRDLEAGTKRKATAGTAQPYLDPSASHQGRRATAGDSSTPTWTLLPHIKEEERHLGTAEPYLDPCASHQRRKGDIWGQLNPIWTYLPHIKEEGRQLGTAEPYLNPSASHQRGRATDGDSLNLSGPICLTSKRKGDS